MCVDNRIKQEFTTPDTPQYNGVAERGLALIETCQQAARIQAAALYPTGDVPKTESLWAEASSWACDAMNRTATSANPERKSPHELWHGTVAPLRLLPFLKPGFYHHQRVQKHLPKALPCFYLGPARNHPRDAMRVLSARTHSVVITRDVTWLAVLPSGEVVLPQGLLDDEVAAEGEVEDALDDLDYDTGAGEDIDPGGDIDPGEDSDAGENSGGGEDGNAEDAEARELG